MVYVAMQCTRARTCVRYEKYTWKASASQKAMAGRVATGLLLLSVLVHTFVLGMYTMELGLPPMAGRTGAVSTFVWMLAIAYLSIEVSTDERGIGIFVTPLLVALQGLVAVHVGALLFAYASFALACVIGITYVLLFRELKRRTPGMFFQRLPSLQVLDRMNMRAVWIGWLLLTIGLIGGAVWLRDVSTQMTNDPRLPHMTITDPKILMAIVTWLIYGVLLASRRWAGLTARRAAWLSAVGFALVLLNFLPVAYFFARSHNFA